MYFIIEHNVRPDGIVNVSETGRSTFALALNYYYERAAKVVVSENFKSSHLLLVNESLGVIKTDHLDGLYVEPEPAPEPEPEPQPEPEPEPQPEEQEESEE